MERGTGSQQAESSRGGCLLKDASARRAALLLFLSFRLSWSSDRLIIGRARKRDNTVSSQEVGILGLNRDRHQGRAGGSRNGNHR